MTDQPRRVGLPDTAWSWRAGLQPAAALNATGVIWSSTAVEVREVPRLARAFRDLLALGGFDGQRRKPGQLAALTRG